jgi:hypothetical protein
MTQWVDIGEDKVEKTKWSEKTARPPLDLEADFVNQQAVVGEIFAKQFGFGMIGTGSVELGEQFAKQDVAAL